MKLRNAVLYTSNIEKSKKFYLKIGFEIISDQNKFVSYKTSDNGVYFSINLADDKTKVPGNQTVIFEIEKIKEEYDRLSKLEIPIDKDLYKEPFGWTFSIRDIDGNKIEYVGKDHAQSTPLNIRNTYIDKSKIENAGRGVFAAENISRNDVIEVCPVLVIPEDDYPEAKKTILRNYYFLWNENKTKAAIALGYGSLYNHSYEPNATYEKDIDNGMITFRAISDINKDEEITVNYNYGDPENKSSLWIDNIS